MNNPAVSVQAIQSTIITLPDRESFMLGQDLAAIYETEPRAITQAVKRNPARFDERFVFQLTDEETAILKCQFGTSKSDLRSQTVIANFAKMRFNPLGFTQAGANMLSVDWERSR